jgi:hypothetical protein
MLLEVVSGAVQHRVIERAFHEFVKERDALIFEGQAVLEVLTVKKEAPSSFRTWGTTRSMTWCHTAEDLYPE